MLILRSSGLPDTLDTVSAANRSADCFTVTINTVFICARTESNANSIRGLDSSKISLNENELAVVNRLSRRRIMATPVCVMLSLRSNITWNGKALQNDNKLSPPRRFLPMFSLSNDITVLWLSAMVSKSKACSPSLDCVAFVQPVSLIENTTCPRSSERACCTHTSTSVSSILFATALTTPITMCSSPCLRE